jgi:hypothetical protein
MPWAEERINGIETASIDTQTNDPAYSYMMCDPQIFGIRLWNKADDIDREIPQEFKFAEDAVENISSNSPTAWVVFSLWVRQSTADYSPNGGYEDPHASDTTFYYFLDHTLQNSKYGLVIAEYVTYKAKHKAAGVAWNSHVSAAGLADRDQAFDGELSTQGGDGFGGLPSGTAPQGGSIELRRLTGNVGEVPIVSTFSEGNRVVPLYQNAYDGHIAGRKGDAIRLESTKAYDVSAMHAVAEGARVAHAKKIEHLGGRRDFSNIDGEIREALAKDGYSSIHIDWYLQGGVDISSGQHLGDRRDFSQYYGDNYPQRGDPVPSRDVDYNNLQPSIPPTPTPTPTQTRIVVRTPFGYVRPAGAHGSDRAEMNQSYKAFEDFRLIDKVDRFFFPVTPNNISYSGLGSRWIEIPRKSHFPIVEWADWVLMKVQFDFLLAHENDGLFVDVAKYIDDLRRMAQRPQPVSIYGLDQLFRLQMKRAQSTGKAMQFVIADFSVKSVARTINEGNKEITSAQCSITLQEITVEEMEVIDMSIPPLAASAIPAKEDDNEVDDVLLHTKFVEADVGIEAPSGQSTPPVPFDSTFSEGNRYTTPASRSTLTIGR